jgi:hypothetical protein
MLIFKLFITKNHSVHSSDIYELNVFVPPARRSKGKRDTENPQRIDQRVSRCSRKPFSGSSLDFTSYDHHNDDFNDCRKLQSKESKTGSSLHAHLDAHGIWLEQRLIHQ